VPSTFFGLNIGTSGLYTYQGALNTTSHNITNTETEGYTRQVLNQEAGVPLRVNSTYGMAGTGVVVTGVTQVRNEYYDLKYWSNNTLQGEYAAKDHYMTQIENYFNEINLEGFTTSFNSLYDSLQELTKDPSSLTVRQQVVNYGKSLTEYFNFLSNSMKAIQEECNFEVKNKVDQINSLGKQIATLTKQINTLEVNGGTANDLRDQRALLVDELSEIVNISVTEKKVGDEIGVTSYTVKIDGQTLVDTNNYNTLVTVPRTEKLNQNDVEGLYDITWSNGQTFNTNSINLGGTLQALFEVRDGNNQDNLRGTANGIGGTNTITLTDANINSIHKLNIPETGIITVDNREYKYTGFSYTADAAGNFTYTFTLEETLAADVVNEDTRMGTSINYKGIPYYMGQMNEFIRTFASAFNTIHKSGEDLEGEDGLDFFNGSNLVTGDDVIDASDNKSYYYLTAANFTITDAVFNNPSKIAAAENVENGVEDHVILDKLIALKTDKTMFKQGAPASFLQTLVAEIGIDKDKASSFAEGQENILKMIANQRLSISGVDMDEEAMNLVRFQNAYNLSAKVISIMDEIYNKLINGMAV
jgi:flagellar hook-associated protein 1 FlgK